MTATARTAGLVFVVFRPDDEALRNLRHANEQCDHTVLIDNTPEPDAALHDRLRAEGVAVVANRNVGGLAAAYNRGVEHLRDAGCDLFYFLDQDSEIEDGYVARMTAAADAVDEEAFLIGPLVYEIKMERYFPPDASPSSPGDPTAIRPTNTLISSGSAVTSAGYEALGPFWEDLFIEYVDTEYAIRAGRRGVPILLNTAEVLRQHTGDITRHGDRFATNHVAARRYYLVRNVIATGRAYGEVWRTLVWGIGMSVREAGTVVLYEQDKARKLVAILLGTVDGFRLRLGALADRHRKLGRYLTR